MCTWNAPIKRRFFEGFLFLGNASPLNIQAKIRELCKNKGDRIGYICGKYRFLIIFKHLQKKYKIAQFWGVSYMFLMRIISNNINIYFNRLSVNLFGNMHGFYNLHRCINAHSKKKTTFCYIETPLHPFSTESVNMRR